jgi:hypothetical protein
MENSDAAPRFLPVRTPKIFARVAFFPGLKYGPRNAGRKAGAAITAIARSEQSASRSTNHPFGYVCKSAFLR